MCGSWKRLPKLIKSWPKEKSNHSWDAILKIMLVEPLAHWEGHFSTHTADIARALASADVDVTLLTFTGFIGRRDKAHPGIRIISVVKEKGGVPLFARMFAGLAYVIPSKLLRQELDCLISTLGTLLLALRLSKKDRYDAVHLLDGYTDDYSFVWFGSLCRRQNLVFTLYYAAREAKLSNWWPEFKAAISSGKAGTGIRLLLMRILETKPISAFRAYQYRKAVRNNHVAFICFTNPVRKSYRHLPFYPKIVKMLRGTSVSGREAMDKSQARAYLGISPDSNVLLHFGVNYIHKDYEVIFRALKDFGNEFSLVFAGRVDPGNEPNIPGQLARRHGLSERTIIFDKYIEDSDKRYYFLAADAIILSYHRSFKGISGVLSDAAPFGLPVIAADVGEIGQMVRNFNIGLTFKVGNDRSLQQAVRRFFNMSDEELLTLKRNLARFAEGRSWGVVAKQFITLYQALPKGFPVGTSYGGGVP
jgi:glycosyltransferase involved in cell wall biosynthesis